MYFLIDRVATTIQRSGDRTDISGAVSIFKALIQASAIPPSCMKACVESLLPVSSTTGSSTQDSREKAWHALTFLLKSPSKTAVLDITLSVPSKAPQDRYTFTTRGAMRIFKHLTSANNTDELPELSCKRLINALEQVYMIPEANLDVLKVINMALSNETLILAFIHEDWEPMMRIITWIAYNNNNPNGGALGDPLAHARSTLFSPSLRSWSTASLNSSNNHKGEDGVLNALKDIMKILESLSSGVDVRKRSLMAEFFSRVGTEHLSVMALNLLITQIVDDGMLLPRYAEYIQNQASFVKTFILDASMPQESRIKALQVIKELFCQMRSDDDKRHFGRLVTTIMSNISDVKDVMIMNAFADLAAEYATDAELEDYKAILAILRKMSVLEDFNSQSTSPTTALTNVLETNMAAAYLVRLFLRCLQTSGVKAILVYDMLVDLGTSVEGPIHARLTAMKLLTRLRCDRDLAIVVLPIPDTLELASILNRTEASIVSFNGSENGGDRPATREEQHPIRVGRSSGVNLVGLNSSRSNTRSASGQERYSKPAPPLWMYPEEVGSPEEPPDGASPLVYADNQGSENDHVVKLGPWLAGIINLLQQGCDWELYSYILVHLPSQLGNPALFSGAISSVRMLRNVVVSRLQSGTLQEPPPSTGVKKGDVALCLFHSLNMLLGYNEHFGRSEQDEVVRTILGGIGAWDRVAQCCIHALSICCHEIPLSIARSLTGILQKMSQIITQSHLARDILEFLGGLARLPGVYVNLTEKELRTVFAICIKYLEHSREQRLKLLRGSTAGANYASNRHSGIVGETGPFSDSNQGTETHKDLPQYVFALAYHVITIWFLSLKLADRSNHVGWITRNLAWKNASGVEIMEEQSQVTLDMMHRTAYLDLGETLPITFYPEDGKVVSVTWLVGLSLLTVETAVGTGVTQLIKRQASGTTYARYQQNTAPLPAHHVPAPTDIVSSARGLEARINVFPNHIFLQLMSNISPTPAPMEPICLPDDDFIKRAISTFDRNDTVDGHKIGVIYIGEGQTSETEILANSHGSEAYEMLLSGLGTKIQLQGASFNTQGLDRTANADGTHTYAWRDRITEIVFHATTMMPTNAEDPQCTGKKKHIGNDFVNIIFNESGLPFKFDTFRSQFNFVNIVITPEAFMLPCRKTGAGNELSADHKPEVADGITLGESGESSQDNKFYMKTATQAASAPLQSTEDVVSTAQEYRESQSYFRIQTLVDPSFPDISPAASYKLVSASALPGLIRQISLNASVFSLVWANREGGEHVSSWRNRLRAIVKLRERFVNTGTSTSAKFPGAKQEKNYIEGDQWRGTVAMGGLAEEEGVLAGLDFSRWAGANPGVI